MRLLAAVWENVYGLFVDDGSIAVGTLVALVATGLWTALTGGSPGLHALGGPLLFLLLMALLLWNLYSTARKAARRSTGG